MKTAEKTKYAVTMLLPLDSVSTSVPFAWRSVMDGVGGLAHQDPGVWVEFGIVEMTDDEATFLRENKREILADLHSRKALKIIDFAVRPVMTGWR